MAADWVALKLAYVNGSMSMRELADGHGVNAAGVMKRAAKEGWEAERQRRSAEVSMAAQTKINETRPNELIKFNEADLQMARALRGMVAKRLNDAQTSAQSAPLTPGEIAQLASAAERAQKIGRLALGANTEGHEHTGAGGGPIGVAAVPVDAYLAARQKVLDEF